MQRGHSCPRVRQTCNVCTLARDFGKHVTWALLPASHKSHYYTLLLSKAALVLRIVIAIAIAIAISKAALVLDCPIATKSGRATDRLPHRDQEW